mmetsp:Transcript_16432/g.27860  ORF Transcript_16432/g.27860 Transcript_16432/m.27860 type:complete len:221 (+) Transcript_16432:164-826(+)
MVPSFLLSTLRRVVMILAPLAPMGWPRATPPPSTLTFEGSRSMSLMLARATAAKASLTSWKSTSDISMPTFLRRRSQAFAGAIAKSMGCTAASSKARILARGLTPLLLASSSLIRTKAAAPSLILEALAAVMEPVLEKEGLRAGNLSGKNFLHSSSSEMTTSLPFLSTRVMLINSSEKAPPVWASLARLYDMMAYSSWASREMPMSVLVFSTQEPMRMLL